MYLSIMIMNMISFMLIWVNHPISMGLLIIAQTLNISMMIGLYSGSFWFSYIIIIVMLSGMLVLFIYMASIASNEKFHTPIKTIYLASIILSIGLIMQVVMELELTSKNKLQLLTNTEILTLINMMNNKKIVILMVLYLFFSMFIISSIVNISKGPLRVNK
uniref:NADH-ubiquinone oxidoreductase chain 6 n=2 Tax=Pyrrhopeplus TaxID=696248 RepID=A0A4Y1JVP8_9HEMI|nr:NADH dehydrogenase subunit 6 [Pyrrhopeplus posthumus]YP_009643399.1 NADH dehydrogenase subunit 6 [Pyrrhopeplus carduelis]APO08803.1 NADH dehydrogenase subunit 6 [Pyrrhopeplus posthumus]APO08816.1 NADH dehydrogenase subunit 6 [Pyrrhopeplus carduelis]